METAEKVLNRILKDKFENNKQEYVFFSANDRYSIIEAMEEYAKQVKIADDSKRNWFEKMPLHWRYIYYMAGGILIGLITVALFLLIIK